MMANSAPLPTQADLDAAVAAAPHQWHSLGPGAFVAGTGSHVDAGTGSHVVAWTGSHVDAGTGSHVVAGTGSHVDARTGSHVNTCPARRRSDGYVILLCQGRVLAGCHTFPDVAAARAHWGAPTYRDRALGDETLRLLKTLEAKTAHREERSSSIQLMPEPRA